MVKIGDNNHIGDNNAIGKNASVNVNTKSKLAIKKKKWFQKHPWLYGIICSFIVGFIFLFNFWKDLSNFIESLFK